MGYVITFVLALLAWLTHIITCLGAAKWGFLIAGIDLFPLCLIFFFNFIKFRRIILVNVIKFS